MKTILVVDDNPASRELLHDALSGTTCRVVEADSGRAGVAKIHELYPDLILMDIQMPGMDGYAALREIRRDPETAALPVVAITAYAQRGDRERTLAAGFDGYLSKPLDIFLLRSEVEQLLRSPKVNPERTGGSPVPGRRRFFK
jgi:CheY-like chemotaxis protein